MEQRDSRRLTGPNLLWDRPGAVLDFAASDVELDAAIGAWREQARSALVAVGWEKEDLAVRRFPGGASVVLSAPIDALYAACEVNEWAFASAAALLRGGADSSLDEAVPRLRRAIEGESRPAVRALQEAAAQRGVGFLWDDDFVSVGLGAGARVWPAKEAPAARDVDWDALHDVPVALVTGTNGKSTTVRLLAAMAEAAGRVPGLSSTDWVRIGSDVVDTGDYSGPGGARQVLRHPRCEIAFLETARGGMLRRGLGVGRADVAAVLNVSDDHLGEFGVNDIEALVETKFIVRHAVEPGGRMVLNADDPRVVRRGTHLRAPVTWCSLDPSHPVLDAHRGKGGEVVFLEEETLIHAKGDERTPIAPVSGIPMTFGGRARHNVQNALAAVGIASGMGLAPAALAGGLRSFDSSPETNPGRGNVFSLGDATVIVDFAHNPDGVAAMLDLAGALPADRRLVTLGQAGDRTDDEIRGLARVAWRARPDRILLKEMSAYLRGRKPGEVVGIMRETLVQAGAPEERIGQASSELAAVRKALQWAREGDLLLLLLQAERDRVLELVASLRGAGWRPGDPVPDA